MPEADELSTESVPPRAAKLRRAALWGVVALGALYSADDGPIPGAFYVLCVGVVYILVRFTRRIRRAP